MSLDLQPCLTGSHQLEVVAYIEQVGARGDAVVRWCPVCGALVIDVERNRRMIKPGGVARPRLPEISRIAMGIVKKDQQK